MSQLLPYLAVASLLLVASALWARQIFLARRNKTELILPRKHPATSTSSHGDIGERIFDLEDWDFVSRNEPTEIKKMFLQERAILAVSWLRRTRRHVSLVMRAHVVAVQQIEDLQLAQELKLALSYLVFLILCDILIGYIWLRGPIRTRKIVGQTLFTMVWLRGAFEQLMARLDPANCRELRADFNHREVRS
jgi:hypothetical protein